ncbi:MAG: hypothetical protein PG980_000101 [Wolbachia endosymbiont of Ctenocephalides felis wCfeJ]|nr:MAG: hypothetical protein PG980_000101 [Wolbachia endosymbiont of Ctenocephalides felis wCfeJ]
MEVLKLTSLAEHIRFFNIHSFNSSTPFFIVCVIFKKVKNKNKAYLFARMKIRTILFSILCKNENNAYLNGDRLLALWSKLYKHSTE